MIAEKTGPSDGSYNNVYDDEGEEDEKLKEKDDLYKKEMEELEEAGKDMREREKEKIEQAKKNRENREEREKSRKESKNKKKDEISEQLVKKTEKRIYSHPNKEGIYTKGKVTDYSQKINKALKRVHGLSSQKKKELVSIIEDCTARKTVATKKEVGEILSKLKYGKYTGSGSTGIQRMLKKKGAEGVDLKAYKRELKNKFNRRDINKIKIALEGGNDPRKHVMKQRPSRSASKASKS